MSALKASATLAVTARVRELRAKGVDVISFGAGEPDFNTPDNIARSAIDALQAGKTHYMPVAGDPAAREAIAHKLRSENDIDCTARDIVISTGAKQSLYLAMQCLLDPGRDQEVVLPTPAWVSYRPMIELAGARVVEVPGSIDNDFKITPAQLDGAITDHTAVLIVNSPSIRLTVPPVSGARLPTLMVSSPGPLFSVVGPLCVLWTLNVSPPEPREMFNASNVP